MMTILHVPLCQKIKGLCSFLMREVKVYKNMWKEENFLGGAVVKNQPAKAGDTSSIPDPG